MEWTSHQKERVEGREANVPWFVGDKNAAYDFAAQNGVSTPQLYRLFDTPDQFRDEDFPERFVVKPKGLHSSQGVMILRRTAPGEYFDSLGRRTITEAQIRTEQAGWFAKNKFKSSYKLMVEEKLIGENGADEIPYDYKLYMFQGINGLIIQYNRNTKPPTAAWFGRDWSPLVPDETFDSEWTIVRPGPPVRPDCAVQMLEDARRLSIALPTPFVSVDMYATTRGPVLGELTLAPGGPYYGKQYRFKQHFDQALGILWDAALKRMKRP